MEAVEMVGDEREALDVLFSLTYGELRRIASRVLGSRGPATLTPTSLVNEAWFKLARSPAVAQTSPLHFKRIAARAMRQVLVETARRRMAQVRGSGAIQVVFDEQLMSGSGVPDGKDVLALDAALEELTRISPRQAKLVEGRFFGGLDFDESAKLLGVSLATVKRDWRYARAWLACHIEQSIEGVQTYTAEQ
jgi:RNA polymerase sigma factor (TIGR02999 family)